MDTLRFLLMLLLMALPLRPVLANTAGLAGVQPSITPVLSACAQHTGADNETPPAPHHHGAECAALCALPLPASASQTSPSPLSHIWHANARQLPLGLPSTPPHAPPRSA